MKNLSLILFTLLLVSCGGDTIDITATDNAKARWGYYSTYIGAINEAQLPSNENKKEMAEAIQPAINMANALRQRYILLALTPDIITNVQPTRIPTQDNSTCRTAVQPDDWYTGKTNRQYNQFYYTNQIPITYVPVTYNSYCLASDYPERPTTAKTVVTFAPTPTSYFQNATQTSSRMDNNSVYYYMILDGIKIDVIGSINFDGVYTPFGILERRSAVGDFSGSKFRIGMDILYQTNKNRFDVSFDGPVSKTRTITYFHTKYGYVTIQDNLTGPIKSSDIITFKFSGGTCTFSNDWFKDVNTQKINENCYYRK